MPSIRPKPELLSPAGNWECARAAVANGADAIFFGLPKFNARLRADNFSAEDLPKLMEFLHAHGVKGYVAFNTLVFTNELEDAETQLREIEEAGVDAVIVQDLGLARMVKLLTPRLRLHASTQMTITSPEGLEFAKRLSIDQAVLSRELSLRELERFTANDSPELPLEVFVHGALCVAYSGQCLTSESLGRRSANRGECAQACRMPYDIIVDGEKRELGDKRYLLSPQDLAAVNEIPRLIELGIRSFKIEGRLKTPEYVAAVTRVYRKAIDAVLAQQPSPITEDDMYGMEMTFSRGLYTGWMHGVNHQELVGARYGKKRGPYLGEVTRIIDRDTLELDAFALPIKRGDGVVFENIRDTNDEQGGSVYEMQGTCLSFRHDLLRMEAIPLGTRVYKTSDPALNRMLRQSFENEIPLRKLRRMDVCVSGRAGDPLSVVCGTMSVTSAIPLQAALKRPLNEAQFREQFSRMGGTVHELGTVEFAVEGEVMVPVSELNRMRRDLLAAVDEALKHEPAKQTPLAITSLQAMLRSVPRAEVKAEPKLHVLCRSMEHINAALSLGIQRLYIDFEDIRRYADVVQHVREKSAEAEVFLATPRIQKSGEAGFFKLIERAGPHGVLIRNLGALAFFKDSGLRVTGDFSLNVANPLTADFLKQNTALEQLTISYDLNFEQVLDLISAAPANWFEITLHQHMPMFHMEHCAFAAFLSDGTDFTNCGRPCEKHKVALRDRVGMEHPLKADVGCRNTLFNAVPQTGASFYEPLVEAGLRHFRVELLEESGAEAEHTLGLYLELLAGKNPGERLWRELRAQSQLGVTRGTLAELV
ncbi:MAG: collagenase-like protease [Verrucomicrobiaceae bacterium]|nr:collagenase-like protease [Verrucomicrobiaceae bacterium]